MNKKSFLIGLVFFLNAAANLRGMDGSKYREEEEFVMVEPNMVDGFFVVPRKQQPQETAIESEPKQALVYGTAASSAEHKETLFCTYPFNTINSVSYKISGIFDGQLGSYVAQFAQKKLIDQINQNLQKNFTLDAAIKTAFTQIHNATYDGSNAGTSVLLAIFQTNGSERNISPSQLCIVHAGNSGAILHTDNGTRPVTKPHTPNGQTVHQNSNLNVVFTEQHKNNLNYLENYNNGTFFTRTQDIQSFYQLNVVRKNQAITTLRGIGHHDFFPSFKAEPSTGVRNLKGNEHFLILANNEFWDAVSPEATSKIVQEFIAKSNTINTLNPKEIAEYLVQTARNLLEKRTDPFVRKDNIAVTVILFAQNLWQKRYQQQ